MKTFNEFQKDLNESKLNLTIKILNYLENKNAVALGAKQEDLENVEEFLRNYDDIQTNILAKDFVTQVNELLFYVNKNNSKIKSELGNKNFDIMYTSLKAVVKDIS